jgi:hypothetical protein
MIPPEFAQFDDFLSKIGFSATLTSKNGYSDDGELQKDLHSLDEVYKDKTLNLLIK